MKLISWISDLRLGFVVDGVFSGGESMLNWILFFGATFLVLIMLIGTGFPSVFANIVWRVRTDFLIDSTGTFRGCAFLV